MTPHRTRTGHIALLAASGAALVVLGMILYSSWLFPEIDQHGDVVFIGQSLWTFPSLVTGVFLLLVAGVVALRRPTTTRPIA